MKKMLFGFLGIAFLSLTLVPTSKTMAANPYKIVWQHCGPGSQVDMVIRCRLIGGDECFANWQGHCDESPGMGG
jgi:hypothetical protein